MQERTVWRALTRRLRGQRFWGKCQGNPAKFTQTDEVYDTVRHGDEGHNKAEGRRLQERTWKPNLHAPERDVAVAERRADDPDPDLVRLGRVHDDLLDGQRLAGGPAHGRCASPEREAG